MPDQTVTINLDIMNLEQLKEVRKELEKIRDLKKEINNLDQEETEPVKPPKPDYPRKPTYWLERGAGETVKVDGFEPDYQTNDAETEIELDL